MHSPSSNARVLFEVQPPSFIPRPFRTQHSEFRNQMARRRQAREAALQLLYQRDINPDTTELIAHETLRGLVESPEMREFAWTLYEGTLAQRNSLDKQIASVADNWRIDRMAATDRNILRMGIFEMQAIQTPPPVVIDECIELAKQFGNEQSGKFVNGILDRLNPEPKQRLEDDSSPSETPSND